MIILHNFIHTPCYCPNFYLFIKIVYSRIVNDIINSELNLLLFFLIVWKNKGFYKLWINIIWYHLSPSNLNPIFIMEWHVTAFTDQIYFFTWFFRCSTVEFEIFTLLTVLLTLPKLFIIDFLRYIVTFVNCNDRISWTKSFHERKILASDR